MEKEKGKKGSGQSTPKTPRGKDLMFKDQAMKSMLKGQEFHQFSKGILGQSGSNMQLPIPNFGRHNKTVDKKSGV